MAGSNSPFTPDTDYTGGLTSCTSYPITVTGVANAAPMVVYQYSANRRLQLHGAEYHPRSHLHRATPLRRAFLHSQSGQRQFNVLINGVQVLTNFDIFATAGAKYKAVVQTFTTPAAANGTVTITLNNGNVGTPLICGIEVLVNTSIVAAPCFTPAPGLSTSAAKRDHHLRHQRGDHPLHHRRHHAELDRGHGVQQSGEHQRHFHAAGHRL